MLPFFSTGVSLNFSIFIKLVVNKKKSVLHYIVQKTNVGKNMRYKVNQEIQGCREQQCQR